MRSITITSALCILCLGTSVAQEPKSYKLSGSVQTDWLLPENDDAIGANKDDYRGDLLGNTYITLNFDSKYINAGLRFETMENPLPGYDNVSDTKPFHGTGLPYFQVTATNRKWIEGTIGTFYEQFGSGFILRSYEERSLGIDNSLLGARVVLKPYKGVRLKALGGVQRYHFSWNTDNPIYGADLELNLDQWNQKLLDAGHYLTLGISGVMRHDSDNTREYSNTTNEVIYQDGIPQQQLTTQYYTLNMPTNVSAMDLRLQWQYNGWNVLGEYAVKSHDPANNTARLSDGQTANYIFRHGNVALLTASYSQKGFSAQVMAKRSEDMAFRSDRTISPNVSSLYINHQPAFAYQHTYSLCTLYPYGTQMDGEWAFQGELSYRFKRNTPLGGKYGTLLRLNMSHIRGLDKTPVAANQFEALGLSGTAGYEATFFGMTDDVYYQDINVTMEKKLNKQWKLAAMYMYQMYNQEIIEGHANNGAIVKSHIVVGDASWSCNKNFSLRIEGQYLTTKQDQGDWAYIGLEASLYKNWMISLADQYNTGLNGGTDTHYFQSAVVWTRGASRLQLGYGRTREGLNCTGGVCRKVPAQRGLTLSWNYIF